MTTIIRDARVLTLDAADTEHAKADILIEARRSRLPDRIFLRQVRMPSTPQA